MAATINGYEFDDDTTNTSGTRYIEGQPSVGMRQYEIENIASPGADGTNQKNFGFRGTTITAQLAFIEDTCPECIQAVYTFANSCVPARFNATFSDISMTNVQGISCVPGVPEVIINNAGDAVAKVVATFTCIQRKL